MGKRKTTAMECDNHETGKVRVTRTVTWFDAGCSQEREVLDITTTRNTFEDGEAVASLRTVQLTHDEVRFVVECARFHGIVS
jgi:hypothetical protein